MGSENKPTLIENRTMGQERALYGSDGLLVRNCAFDGQEDGESALKESRRIRVEKTFCNLRYPFWHDVDLSISDCELTPLCRAALWYSEQVRIEGSRLHGIKALRECGEVALTGCEVRSPEFGWFCRDVSLSGCDVESEYFLLRSSEVRMKDCRMTGKYSFQYVDGGVIENCTLDTKDAFWHSKNVTVRGSVIKGEYLGWYSENLTLIDCTIIGTQPLCYCRGLKLSGCRMERTDLAFERSEVEAEILSPVESIKNPRAGRIVLPSVGALILDDPEAAAEVVIGN